MNRLLLMAAAFGSMIPSANDWQVKIDTIKEEYHSVVKNLPRKAKKKRKKELLKTINFYYRMKDYSMF